MTISPLGTAHVAAAFAALALGLLVLLLQKGTQTHRALGIGYAVSMLGVNATALGLYRLTGHFGPFHALALISLATIGVAVAAAIRRWRGWLVTHYQTMSYSYIGLLAATTTEALIRVPALQVRGAARGIALGVSIAVAFVVIGRFIVRRVQRSVLASLAADQPGNGAMRQFGAGGAGLLLAMLTAVAAQAQDAGENLTLKSSTVASFRQLLSGAAPEAPADVPATLRLPAAASGPAPAVVIVHTLAGYREANEGWQARELRKAGFATLTYDSFAARGMGDLVHAPLRGPPPYASALADAFAALAALARDPRIDPRRIAILGFSFGGEAAHLAAFERLRARLAEGEQRFAAHVAYYPAGVFGTVAAPAAYTGAPVLLMIGGDDTLPSAKAEAYLAYARTAGYPAPVELTLFERAHHGWTDPGLGAAREYPYLASTRACPWALITPRAGLVHLVDGRERPFDDAGWEACIRGSLGYTMGYDEAIREKSTACAVDFLKRNLPP